MTVDEAFNVVVETPVAPVTAPAAEILMVGVERNLLKPLASVKVMPLITLELLLEAVRLMPLIVLALLLLAALVRFKLSPLTVVEISEVLALVRFIR